jgi:hypothetical protein
VTGRATFGDFLQSAHRHLDPGASASEAQVPDNLEEAIGALSRLVAVIGRYTQDLTVTLPDIGLRARPVLSAWAEARLQARDAQAASARYLAFRDPTPPGVGVAHSAQTLGLGAAAASLRMGRDLLHTHFAPGPGGGWRERSEWAPVITSEAVTRALLVEIASFARQSADLCSVLAVSRSPDVARDGQAQGRLLAACQWLWMLDASVRAAQHHEPMGRTAGELLSAIPVNTLPPRRVLHGGEPVAMLCDGAIASAERVRHLAWLAADHVPASRNVTVASLRTIAENSTVISHNCASLLDTLTTRVQHAWHREASDRLAAAAEAAKRARDTWLRAAREVGRIRTVTPGPVSLAAAEAGDLASWTGRLAYADPHWSPADGPNRPVRLPETLAMEDVPQLVAAAHHACETLAGLALAEHDQIRAAARAGRILVPTRSLPEGYDIPYPFARAPHNRVEVLLGRYTEARHASRQAADAVSQAAEIARSPSRTLALARSAVAGRTDPVPDVTDTALQHSAEARVVGVLGPVETALLDLGITDPLLLARSAEIDHDAERLIVEAAVAADTHQRSVRGLSRSTGTAALVNHVLQSGDPRAVALLRPARQAQREPPEREP